MGKFRVGQGYDVHAYADGDGIIVGGVKIECGWTIVAHSDGDVLIHALCDALLGASGRGDIGGHFADSDPANRNRDSREFLREICRYLREDGYSVSNADMTLIAQAPKMAPHIEAMRQNLAADMQLPEAQINIKATTTERLGFIGREEGIAAAAVVLLERD